MRFGKWAKLLLAALPIAVIRHPERLRRQPIPTILTLGIAWLLAQIVTDVVRNSAPEDFLRGWSKIFFVLVNFTVVCIVVCRSLRRFIIYGIGMGLGTIFSVYLHPSSDATIAPWKFGFGIPVTLLVMIWAAHSSRHRYLGILLPLTGLAIVHAFEDLRSLALITFMTAIYCLYQMSTTNSQAKIRGKRLAILAVTITCVTSGFIYVYSRYAEQGVFGKYAQRKLAAQSSGEGGLLLGGRSEILASSQAILDSPFLGHGSWARDPTYSAILAERRAELGYKDLDRGKRDDLIPTHSYIFGGWVEAGVAGGLFWLFVLGYSIVVLLRTSGCEPLLPLFVFVGFMLVWDTLFSPLGMPTRFIAPYYLAAMVVLGSFRGSQSAFLGEI